MKHQKQTSKPDRPRIVEDKCTGCGLCAELCIVYEKQNGRVTPVRTEICSQCGQCGATCPAGAIEGTSNETKRITKAQWKTLPSPESLQFLFRSRRSVRRYKPESLKQTDLEKILEAGRYTPTGVNRQGIHYTVVNDPDKIEELRKMAVPVMKKMFAMAVRIAHLPFSSLLLGKRQSEDLKGHFGPAVKVIFDRYQQGDDRLFYHAPALILTHGEKQDDTMVFSCHVALFNCSMMAHLMGIGCMLNSYALMTINNNARIKRWLGIPKGDKCFGAMTLGYQRVEYKTLVKRNPVNVHYI